MMKKNEYKQILKTFTILYIEDEDNIRNNLCLTLKLIFKDVLDTSNAEDALQIYKSKKPNLILSDINLPGMSGIELSQIIRKDDLSRPIILLSAHTDTHLLLEATKLKLVSYLTKPVDFEELYGSFIDASNELKLNHNENVQFKNDIYYDILNSILYENNIEKDMTVSERKLLELFINNKNNTLSIDYIKNYIWEDSDKSTDSAFKSLLNKLRHKIGANSIKNVSGIGYHLVYE